MDNIIEQLRDRAARVAAKVEKAKKALEAAVSELADVEAAIRVIEDMQGGGGRVGVSDVVAERQANILKIMDSVRASASEPKELFSRYVTQFGDDITLDTFRTTLWRMKGKGPFHEGGEQWSVENQAGRYWKEKAILALSDFDEMFDEEARHKENEAASENAAAPDAG